MNSRITETAVRLAKRYRRASDLRWRQVPRLAVAPRSTGRAHVYYLAPSPSGPAGGVRVIYRHVDSLNAAGIPATVIHSKTGFRCTWFANQTRVAGADEVVLGPDDVLVVPECYAPGLRRLPAGVRVVIFNQGVYHTFDHVPYETTEPGAPYTDLPGLVALLTVSQDSMDLLQHIFPALPVHVTRQMIDPHVFHPADTFPARRIAYVANRRPAEREQLRHILRARGLLDRWDLVPIAARTESEAAAIMRGSAIFLSFSEREGFGLPPAEAMASGCFVVGYHGQGGREFFEPRYCAPVPDSDLLTFARAVEQACTTYDQDPDTFAKAGRLASEWILSQYSAEALVADLLAFYRPLLGD